MSLGPSCGGEEIVFALLPTHAFLFYLEGVLYGKRVSVSTLIQVVYRGLAYGYSNFRLCFGASLNAPELSFGKKGIEYVAHILGVFEGVLKKKRKWA